MVEQKGKGVVIKSGAQVNIGSGDIGGGSGNDGGVTIEKGARVNIGSGDITGGDKIVNGVVWKSREGSRPGFGVDPAFDEENQVFKEEVDVCGNVIIRRDGEEVGNGEIDLHQALGNIGGRIILGPDLIVDMDTSGRLTICGVQIDDDMLQQLRETPFEIARITNVQNTQEKSELKILAEITLTQKMSSRGSGNTRGERTVKVEISGLGKDEEAVTTQIKDLTLQSGDKKRQVWKRGVELGGKSAQMRVLYVEKS